MSDSRIEKGRRYIEENLEKPLTLGEVSRKAGMSRFHFSRAFKAETGISFKEHLNRKRIEAAKNLMKDEDMNVTEACYSVGFNNHSYFCRVFKKLEGVAPSSYRRGTRTTSYTLPTTARCCLGGKHGAEGDSL